MYFNLFRKPTAVSPPSSSQSLSPLLSDPSPSTPLLFLFREGQAYRGYQLNMAHQAAGCTKQPSVRIRVPKARKRVRDSPAWRALAETTGIGGHLRDELETQCNGNSWESRKVTLAKTLSQWLLNR